MEGGEVELGRGISFAGYFNLFCKFEVTSCVVRPLFHNNFCDFSFFAIFFAIVVDEYCVICAISFSVHLHIKTRLSYNFFSGSVIALHHNLQLRLHILTPSPQKKPTT
jgi:hypothetical protein